MQRCGNWGSQFFLRSPLLRQIWAKSPLRLLYFKGERHTSTIDKNCKRHFDFKFLFGTNCVEFCMVFLLLFLFHSFSKNPENSKDVRFKHWCCKIQVRYELTSKHTIEFCRDMSFFLLVPNENGELHLGLFWIFDFENQFF